MKYYELAKDVTAEDSTICLVDDGYHHVPFIGDNIMVAPSTLTGTGTGLAVTGVTEGTEGGANVFIVTLGAAFGATANKGDILVEAAKAGAETTAMVTNPNAYFDKDNDFFYDPNLSSNVEEGEGAQYSYTPALIKDSRVILNLAKCNKLPPAVLAMNTRTENGWFGF